MPNDDELVTVPIAPGRWQKMTRRQAAAAGYDLPGDEPPPEPEPDAKTRTPANKARKAPAKAPAKKATSRRRS